MKLLQNLAGGLAGAVVLNLIHESARHISKDAPRVNEIGAEGMVKMSEAVGVEPPEGKSLYASTLAADLAGNAIYYSMIGKGKPKNIWSRGAALGFTAGLGALGLTRPLGLDDEPVNKNTTTKLLTLAWYTVGGLATAGAITLLRKLSR